MPSWTLNPRTNKFELESVSSEDVTGLRAGKPLAPPPPPLQDVRPGQPLIPGDRVYSQEELGRLLGPPAPPVQRQPATPAPTRRAAVAPKPTTPVAPRPTTPVAPAGTQQLIPGDRVYSQEELGRLLGPPAPPVQQPVQQPVQPTVPPPSLRPAAPRVPAPIIQPQPTTLRQEVRPFMEKATQTTQEAQQRIDQMLSQIDPFQPIYRGQIEQILRDTFETPFAFDPAQDPFLKQAQQQSQQQVMNEMNRRGLIPSTMTAERLQQVSQQLVPQYEQIAFQRYNQNIQNQLQRVGVLERLDESAYNQYKDFVRNTFNKIDVVEALRAADLRTISDNLDTLFQVVQKETEEKQAQLAAKDREIKLAQQRTELRGFVDNRDSVILGVPVGTLSETAQAQAFELLKQSEKTSFNLDADLKRKDKDKENTIGIMDYEASQKEIAEEGVREREEEEAAKETEQLTYLANLKANIAHLSPEDAIKVVTSPLWASNMIDKIGPEKYLDLVNELGAKKLEAEDVAFERGMEEREMSLKESLALTEQDKVDIQEKKNDQKFLVDKYNAITDRFIAESDKQYKEGKLEIDNALKDEEIRSNKANEYIKELKILTDDDRERLKIGENIRHNKAIEKIRRDENITEKEKNERIAKEVERHNRENERLAGVKIVTDKEKFLLGLEEKKRNNDNIASIRIEEVANNKAYQDGKLLVQNRNASTNELKAQALIEGKEDEPPSKLEIQQSLGEDFRDYKSLPVEQAKSELTDPDIKGMLIGAYGVEGYNTLWDLVFEGQFVVQETAAREAEEAGEEAPAPIVERRGEGGF